MAFTDQQRQAIETIDRDLLVSASAGSGKTTVLAQHVVRLVRAGIPLTEILAVTFTEAAASDMRRKIAATLREHMIDSPGERMLASQLQLVERAPISTLHSFCLDVCRSHAQLLDLDTGFRLLDADEARLVRNDAAEAVLERWFCLEEGEEADLFRQLVDAYGGRQGGGELVRGGIQVLEFMQTLPDPERWCEQAAEAFQANCQTGQASWIERYRSLLRRKLEQALAIARPLLEASAPGTPLAAYRTGVTPTIELIRDALARLDKVQSEAEWQALLEQLREPPSSRLSSIRNAGESVEKLKGSFTSQRDKLKKLMNNDLAERICAQGIGELLDGLRQVGPLVKLLLRFSQEIGQEYQQQKQVLHVLDFSDLERNALNLLTRYEDAARRLRARFRHVLVDEYQDINPLQDALIHGLCHGPDDLRTSTLFLVGDPKQSIYGFRLADPGIIRAKAASFSMDPAAPQVRIPLAANFRSRPHILAGINHVCDQIFRPELGGSYEPTDCLIPGFIYPAHPDLTAPLSVEAHLLEKKLEETAAEDGEAEQAAQSPWAELDGLEREASVAAWSIRDLVGGKQVWDEAAGHYRPAMYRDVVVLMRATRERADKVAGILRAHSIPVYADLTTGFLEATEVLDVLSLLELFDNAAQDLPCAAVLRSPLVALSEDELATIRIHKQDVPFHQAVAAYAADGSEPGLRARLASWLNRVGCWRQSVIEEPLAIVLWRIYRETGYLEYLQGLPGGAARRANLLQLHDRARQFDKFSRRGLYRFLRFVRQLRDGELDIGAAPTLSDADDVVRIMSIHKSKGLEFPIVFVLDLGKGFNFRDERDAILLHREHFVGLDRVDLERMIKVPTLARLIIEERKRFDQLAEEQRLLYVAMTRAREHLVLIGSLALGTKLQTFAAATPESWSPMMLSASCFYDWIIPVLAKHPDTAECLGGQSQADRFGSHWTLSIHDSNEIASWPALPALCLVADPVLQAMARLEPAAVSLTIEDQDAVDAAMARLNWQYPLPHLSSLPGKRRPSGFKKKLEMELAPDDMPGPEERSFVTASRRPRFLDAGDAKPEATVVGTATHAVLQHLDLRRSLTAADIEEQIEDMVNSQRLGAGERELLRPGRMASFFKRSLGQRLRAAARQERELPFSMLLDVAQVTDIRLVESEKHEKVLVQGIMDCLFWEADGIVLLDYKTDAKMAPEEHYPQMRLYRQALQQIYGAHVKECHLVYLNHDLDHLCLLDA